MAISWQASRQSLFISTANCQLSFPVMQSADNTLSYTDTGSVMKPGRAFRSEDIADAVYNHPDNRFQAALYSFLGKAQDDPSLQSVRGTLFAVTQHIVHTDFCKAVICTSGFCKMAVRTYTSNYNSHHFSDVIWVLLFVLCWTAQSAAEICCVCLTPVQDQWQCSRENLLASTRSVHTVLYFRTVKVLLCTLINESYKHEREKLCLDRVKETC